MILTVDTEEGWMENRNGTAYLGALQIWTSGNDRVYIGGVSKARGQVLRGGLCITKDAMRELCERYLREQGDPNDRSEQENI
jgi:exopolyphosphatase/pppGpp-phosphohydrolase